MLGKGFGKLRFMLKKIHKYVPWAPMVLFAILPIAVIIHVVGAFSTRFADFFNIHIASVYRAAASYISGMIPFSFAETIIIFLPAALIIAIFGLVPRIADDRVKSIRYIFSLLAVLAFIYISFVFTLATGYQGSSVTDKLGVERRGISAEELYDTAAALTDMVNELARDVTFSSNGQSVMPYDLDELNRKLNDAYVLAAQKYDFIMPLRSNVKSVALSEPMTYTHISGVYTFFTGEANVNINFPDYVIVYTMAHEMSHQRGIAPEDEANFMAYLVCMESDDPNIRYAAAQSLLEYVYSALSSADRDLYRTCYRSLSPKVIDEIRAYNTFFDKYEENVAATVSGTVNNTYLVLQGTPGTRSYGLVADLAVICYTQGMLPVDP